MKTTLLLSAKQIKALVAPVIFFLSFSASSQVITAPSITSGLNFDNPYRLTTSDLTVGSAYLFTDVLPGVFAKVTIDSLVNGAKVNKIDDNSDGTGYKSAFQPAVQSGGIIGKSYAVFSIKFLQSDTVTPAVLPVVNATPLDLDGSNTLKEFAQINMGSGIATSYLMASPDILVEPLSGVEVIGRNVLGVERTGIDTSALANMFTVANSNISSFTVKYGTITTNSSSATRQFSLYLKRFEYPGITLPVKLISFSAVLNSNNKVDLLWKTTAEVNLSHFMVEKSFDGTNYQDAGMVFSIGNTATDNNYKLTDNVAGVTSPVIYYRLRSVDNDGKFQLSETRIIRISKEGAANLTILTYPNPATSELRITVPATWQNKQVVYELFALNGQLVFKSISAAAGQTVSKNISSLQSGVYNLRVTCEGQMATQKIVKQ